jgi:hypothetical protein
MDNPGPANKAGLGLARSKPKDAGRNLFRARWTDSRQKVGRDRYTPAVFNSTATPGKKISAFVTPSADQTYPYKRPPQLKIISAQASFGLYSSGVYVHTHPAPDRNRGSATPR